MTPEQNEKMRQLFMKYGSPSREADLQMHGYLVHPDDLDTIDRVRATDKSAEHYIANYQAKIEQLQAYRIALQERYSYLSTAPTAPVVKLIRHKDYQGMVHYYLKLYDRNLLDGKEVLTKTTTFPGKERHKAISAYKEYIKAHPGIMCEMDIEKGKWER